MNRRSSLLCALFLLAAGSAVAQRSFSDSSRLTDSVYSRNCIREITDSSLFASFNREFPGFQSVSRALGAGSPSDVYRAWARYWGGKKQPHYLFRLYRFQVDTELLTDSAGFRRYIAEHPEERDSLIERAEMLMHNRILTWGDRIEQFGERVDFNRALGQSGQYGFHYWMWARPLTMAYTVTGDDRYLAKFDQFFNDWYEQRNSITRTIPELDVVYYELGLGVRNRMFIEHYLIPFKDRSLRAHERMLKTMLGGARWLYELERWEGYRPGNWQVHGAYMLAQIALVFPEFRESPEWLRMGLQRMAEHLREDFFEDGGHSERAPRNYTLATYLLYRNLYYLLTAYGGDPALARSVRESLGKTVDWWVTLLAPTGEIPPINDSQRGLYPSPILKDAAEFFGKPELYGVMEKLLDGPRRAGAALPPWTSRDMASSGFTVMRTGWTRDALYMNINYGPFGGFHTHSDLLDFEIYAYGRALAVDAGIGMTYDDPLYVPWYKSSAAHNMLVVNGRNMRREGVRGEDVTWTTMDSLDYFAATSRGYDSLGIVHRRRIAFVKPDYWFVSDDVSAGRGGDTLQWYIHSPEEIRREGAGFAFGRGPGLLLLPADSLSGFRQGKGPAASTRVRIPGKTEEIDWLRLEQTTGRGPVTTVGVLLVPFRTMPSLPGVEKTGARCYRITRGGQTDHLLFAGGAYRDETFDTDGEFVWLRATDGVPVRWAVVNGTFLRLAGREVWHSAQRGCGEGVLER